jgi:uncharacterized protein DUF4872/butirosin biosynthesis protein H-like
VTEHRKLKALIRDRMARTGESYSTARRVVLARAAGDPLPAGLAPGYRTFGAERHRLSALLAHVLAARGVVAPHTGEPFTEAMLAGLGGGVGFMYFVFEYERMPPVLSIVAQHHPQPWVPAALDRLGIPYTEKRGGKPDLAALRAGLPAFLTVDQSRLPWHGMEPGFGTDPYVVVVAGADGDTFHLDDDAAVPNPIGAEQLAAAWSAHRKGRHHRLTVGEGAVRDLPGAVRDAVRTTVAHLTGPVLGNTFDVNFGFSGMAKLAAQLRDTRGRTGWLRRFGEPVAFYHGLRRLYACLETELTGPGATRPVYADFLEEAAPLVGPAPAQAAALFRESGRLWSELAGRASEVSGSLGAYTEIAEERLALMFSRGAAAAGEIRALTARMDALIEAAGDPPADRAGLFAGFAELVEECLALERRAVGLLAEV